MPTQNQNNNQATNKSSGLMAYMVKKKNIMTLMNL